MSNELTCYYLIFKKTSSLEDIKIFDIDMYLFFATIKYTVDLHTYNKIR